MTIDLNLTQKIDVILKRHLKISKAKSIFSTLINASTFEIISINSLSRSGQKKDNNNWNDSINTLAEWGSLLKPLTYALGFETGEIRINQVFKKIEPLRVDRFTIRDYKQLKGNNLTLRNVFVYSSNIIPAKIGLGIGKERFEAGLRKFGFYDHIKIFPRTTTLFPHQMRDINVATISFGHGIAISQTHVARLYAAILNGGVIGDLKVFNKSSRCRKIGSICQSGTTRILSKRTSDYIRALLFESVQRGTGSRANVANLVVMGQTGTTEKMSSRGYKKHKLLSSFAAGFRIGKKDFVLALSVDEPVGSIKTFGFATGGWVAAPAVAEIAEMMMAVKRPRQ
jgi:cell division protein FtsI (penicillin-binding protein 3)